jgi:hypothetical protein
MDSSGTGRGVDLVDLKELHFDVKFHSSTIRLYKCFTTMSACS